MRFARSILSACFILVLLSIKVVLLTGDLVLSDSQCSCDFCPGYGGDFSDGYAAQKMDPVCPSRSVCPKPPDRKTELSYCFGMSSDKLKTGICSCATGRFLEETGSEWIDPDTPPEVNRSMNSRSGNGHEYRLAFSDEFNVDGRKFGDDSDPKWTAMERTPWTNMQINRYVPELAYTDGGVLHIGARLTPEEDKEAGRSYQTAMLQSWNKFCFRGGIVDVRVRLPGDGSGRGAGLWPAVWMMGNLGRATYLDSTEGLWPFSASSTCPEGRQNQIVNAIEAQTLNACNSSARSLSTNWKPGYDRARGAGEIDLLEAMLGNRYDDYEARIENGHCQDLRMEFFDNLIINPAPYGSQSVILAPGIPMWSVKRPEQGASRRHAGCFWSDRTPVWHKELFPERSPTYPKFPDPWKSAEPCRIQGGDEKMRAKICPTVPKVDFFGASLGANSSKFASEALTANTQVPLTSFLDGINLRLEVNIEAAVGPDSKDIAVAFYIDDFDTPVFQIPASVFAAVDSPLGDQPPWRLEPRAVPDEPMYLILNLDISPTWGWKTDTNCCTDCTEECIACNPPGEQRDFLTSFCAFMKSGNNTSFEIDYIRVYTNQATCEPPEAPTKTYIGMNANKYYDRKNTSSEYPLKCVRSGGGKCDVSDSACGGKNRGKCTNGKCVCTGGIDGRLWTGPDCLVLAAGPSQVCPYFLDSQGEDLLQFSDHCVAPLPFNSEGKLDAFTPNEGELVDMIVRNCEKVFAFASLNKEGTFQDDAKKALVAEAVGICRTVMFDGVFGECCPEVRANLALKAWGDLIMEGRECCNLPGMPYCVARWVKIEFYRVTLFAFPLLAFILIFSLTHCAQYCRRATPATDEHPSWSRPCSIFKHSNSEDETKLILKDELEQEFHSSFFWREYRDASEAWLLIVCGAFANLASQFGFQDDSVRNQLQHFLSLWQSQVVLLKDAQDASSSGGRGSQKDENGLQKDAVLLEQAMQQLASKLLNGYDDWASGAGLDASDLNLYPRGTVATNISFLQKPSTPSSCTIRAPSSILQSSCIECAAFLLVWGEGGVLRFCPELICFLVDCVLGDAGKGREEEKKSPGEFLCNVIRPIYNAMFDETYESVDVDPKSHDDKKKLQPQCISYIPADKSNYDDWNELFNNVIELDGRLDLRRFRSGQRVEMLCGVEWENCISGYKTHREVHSYWAVYAAFHRLIYLHVLMFVMLAFACIESTERKFINGAPMMGRRVWVRISAGGLLAPCHTVIDEIALWMIQPNSKGTSMLFRCIGCFAPIASYLVVRLAANQKMEGLLNVSLPVHGALSLLAAVLILFVPRGTEQKYFHQLRAARPKISLLACSRLIYWACILGAQCYMGYLVNIASTMTLLGNMGDRILSQPLYVIGLKFGALNWDIDLCFWLFVWGCTFLAFCASSFFWFTFGNCILGICIAFHQRSWKLFTHFFVNPIAEIEARIHEKVLKHQRSNHNGQFQKIWDKVIVDMYEDHKLTTAEKLNLSFGVSVGESITWHVPKLLEHSGSSSWNLPDNMEAQWRIHAMARCLSLRMPRPYCLPNVPCLTTLIPHYGETIIQEWSNLVPEHSPEEDIDETALLEWLLSRYSDEWHMFLEANEEMRHASHLDIEEIRGHAENDKIRSKIERWASMRTQTLWRTVAGICKYHSALELLSERPGQNVRFKSEECFRCLIAMQRYAHFKPSWLLQVECMFEELPNCLNIAFIDHEDDRYDVLADSNIHPKQHRRYYACLIDKDCKMCADNPHRRVPRFKVELPGFPILGDGKGDNQNCAVIYSRGEFIQAIDANQGGYLEQMLLLPSILAEFRENPKRIVGCPEHITSDFGSIGDFAASSELAFGTIIQRSVAAQGGRMHYGHPDLMNKIYMIHQGGVSKATKTINLSEDIFAGMDFTLRGGEIVHREFFHVTKGRDLGFTAVLSFFSKLSAGTGEQVLTRQVLRISRSLGLERVLPFYHMHAGFYFMQFLSTQVILWLSHVWMLASFMASSSSKLKSSQILVDNQYLPYSHFATEPLKTKSFYICEWFAMNYGPFTALYVLANSLPLLLEIWLQQGMWKAVVRYTKQMVTLAPLHFIFQGKVIAFYISNEVLYGGAKYIATGRELPTHRRPFLGDEKKEGLYQEFAEIAHYEGCRLMALTIGIFGLAIKDDDVQQFPLGWVAVCGLVIVSWLWTPYIFNPYQCDQHGTAKDRKAFWMFFVSDGSKAWKKWCETLIHRRSAVKHTALELVFWLFWVMPVYSLVTVSLRVFSSVHPNWGTCAWWRIVVNLPAGSTMLACFVLRCMVCDQKEPTPLKAGAVGLFFWLAELGVSTMPFFLNGWNRSWITILLYKLFAVEFWMWASEIILRLYPSWVAASTWLLGWRLCGDLCCASIIFTPLNIVSCLSHSRQILCCCRDDRKRDKCPLHNLVVFRAFGGHARRRVSLKELTVEMETMSSSLVDSESV